MIKWYHILITLVIGVTIGYILPHNESEIVAPQIKEIKSQIQAREPKENKLEDSIKSLKSKVKYLTKDNIELKARADKSAHHFAEVKKMIPVTRKDTIEFLKADTTACEEALLRSQELAAGLSIEVMTDNAIIENLDSLNSDLQADKKDLVKVDSLNQIEKKQLRKAGRKKFFKGLGIGGAIVAILIAVF